MYHIVLTIVVVFMASAAHTATLEIPGPDSTQSGIQLISGWKCEATGPLTIRFDGGNAVPLVYGSERGDTRSVCGDANNGFVAVMNWSNLNAGKHTAVVYDNGVEFDRATFKVVSTGAEFLKGVSGVGVASLSNGQVANLVWSEASQGFVATDFTPAPTVRDRRDNCTSRTITATVHDSRGGRATWTVELECEYQEDLEDQFISLDIIAHTDFRFSLTGLNFMQDGYVYGFGNVFEEWQTHPGTGQDYTAGETAGMKIYREDGSGLDFGQPPFTILYYGKSIMTFE